MRKYGSRSRRPRIKRRTTKRTYKKRVVRKAKRRSARPEVKKCEYSYGTQAFNSQIQSGGDILPLAVPISQGTAQYQRLGNKIYVKRIQIKVVISWQDTEQNVNNARVGIRLIVARPTTTNFYQSVVSGDLSNLISLNNTSQIFDGTMASYLAPINKEAWVVKKDKRMTFLNPYLYNGGSPAVQLAFPTGITTKTLTFDVIKNKTIVFNDGLNSPLNFPWVMMIGFAPLNFSAGAILNTPLSMHYQAICYYTDV